MARIFDYIKYGTPHLPEALSIGEFKGNTGGEKFQCALTDPKSKQVLDILPSGKFEILYGYFSTFENMKDIEYIVIDMNNHFKIIAKTCFPRTTIEADRFHVIRQACWAIAT